MSGEFKVVSVLNPTVVLTAGPAISAGLNSQNTGTVAFSNSNGVSFGLAGGVVTASVQAGAAAGIGAVAAGTQTQTSGTVTFGSSAGNITFGMNNGYITGSAPAAGGAGDGYNIIGVNGGATNLSTTLQLSNANNVSFGLNAGTITASASYPTQTAYVFSNNNGVSFGTNGSTVTATVKTDYLTTAALSGHSHGMATTTTNGSLITVAGNSAGYTLAVPPFVTAAAGGADGYNQAGFTNSTANSTQNLVWAGNSNGSGNITFGLTGSTITASAPSGGGGGIALQADGSTYTSGTVSLGNSNGFSFKTTNGSVVGSYTVPTQSVQTQNMVSVQGSTGNITFANANNVTFGFNASTVTASASYPAQTLQPAVAQLNGSSGTMSFAVGSSLSASSNASTITFGLASNITTALQSAGAYLTTARASNDAIGLNTAITQNGVSMTANSSGLSLNFPAFLTTAAQSNHSHGNPTLALTNINGTTASASNGLTLSLSAVVPAQTVQPVAASGSNGSFAFSTLSFGNSNGLSFYTTNGSIVGSYTDAGAGGGITAINVSAGTTNTNISNLSFANSNGVSFGINGSTITASAAGGAGASPVYAYIPYYPASTAASTLGATGTSTASAHFWPVSIVHPCVFNRIEQLQTCSWITSSVSGQQTISSRFGIYTNNAGTLSLMSSGSFSMALTNSSQSATLSYPVAYGTAGGYTYTTTACTGSAQGHSLFGTAGNRIFTYGFGNSMSLSEGIYWMAVHQRMSSSSANVGLVPALAGNVMLAAENAGPIGSYTASHNTGPLASIKWGWGPATSTGSAGYSATALPPAYPITAINNTATQMPMNTFISR